MDMKIAIEVDHSRSLLEYVFAFNVTYIVLRVDKSI